LLFGLPKPEALQTPVNVKVRQQSQQHRFKSATEARSTWPECPIIKGSNCPQIIRLQPPVTPEGVVIGLEAVEKKKTVKEVRCVRKARLSVLRVSGLE